MKQTGREIDADRLATIIAQMRSWSELTETVDGALPSEIVAALQTGRPELISAFTPKRPLIAGLVNLVRVLLQTNIALQDHAQELAKRTRMLDEHLKGLITTCRRIDDFANFRHYDDGDLT